MVENVNEASLETLIIENIDCYEHFSLFWIKDIPVLKNDIISLLKVLASRNINVNQVLQVTSRQGNIHILFTVPDVHREINSSEVQTFSDKFNASWDVHDQITRIVLTGSGIRTHSQVADKIVRIMKNNDLEILMLSSSEVTLSIFVHARQAPRAHELLSQNLLHKTF